MLPDPQAVLAHGRPFAGAPDDARWLVVAAALLLCAAAAAGFWLLGRTMPATRRERALHAASVAAPVLLWTSVLSLPFGDPAHVRAWTEPPLLFLLLFAAIVLAPRPWTAALAYLVGLAAIALYEVGALLRLLPDGGEDRPAGTFLIAYGFLAPLVFAAAAIRTRGLWPRSPQRSRDGT